MVVALVVSALAGCTARTGSQSQSPAAQVEPVQATCDRLFAPRYGEEYDLGLWSKATELVAESERHSAWRPAEHAVIARQLRRIAQSAEPAIRPHVSAMAHAVASDGDSDGSVYESASRAVARECITPGE